MGGRRQPRRRQPDLHRAHERALVTPSSPTCWRRTSSATCARRPRWAARGQAFAQAVGRARPALALTAAQVALLDDALAGELPTVLRRQWEDWRDDLG